MRKAITVLASLMLLLGSMPVKAQSTEEQHTFTLEWKDDISTNSTYAINHLLSFDNQPSESSVCGQSPEGYNIWCGQIRHYASDPMQDVFDFNFPSQLLPGCSEVSAQSSTVYTSQTRRTVYRNASFSCVDANATNWTVQTNTTTNQYRSWCRFKFCWGSFPGSQQPAITGTVEQVVTQ